MESSPRGSQGYVDSWQLSRASDMSTGVRKRSSTIEQRYKHASHCGELDLLCVCSLQLLQVLLVLFLSLCQP
jgi:hypothetical protein